MNEESGGRLVGVQCPVEYEVCACVCIFIKQMHPINEYYYIIIILIQLILLDNDTYRIDEFIPRLKTRTVSRDDDDVGG